MCQIGLQLRYHQPRPSAGLFQRTLLIVDGTACQIQRPQDRATDELFWSAKHHYHAIKYIVCVGITSGLIMYVSKPYPGSTNDKLALDLCGLLDALPYGTRKLSVGVVTGAKGSRCVTGEWMLGDLGFVGCDAALTAIKRHPGQRTLPPEEKAYNDLIGHVRSLVEHQFARFKRFKCLSTAWRHDILSHNRAFQVIAQAVQLDLLLNATHEPHPAVMLHDCQQMYES